MRHIIGILLQNEAGALNRVAGLFSNRGYNIESLAVAPTDDPTLSRVTLVTTGSEGVIQQIVSQLHKLIDVVSVDDLTADEHVERELVLLKLEAEPAQQETLRASVLAAGGRWLDAVGRHALIELTGSEAEVTAFVAQMARRVRLTEVVRSGTVAVARGAGSLRSQF